MANLIELVVPKINAQADAVAQPTFGSINIGGGSGITGQVLLNSDKTSVEVGERFKVRVQVNTNDVNIEEYRIIINFDPTKIQIVDADSETQGIQVRKLDTVFSPEEIQNDNVSNNNLGTVKYVAKSSTPVSLNTEVIEIEFQAQATGRSTIELIEGAAGTQLIRQAGQGLVFTPNRITLEVAQTQNTPDPEPQPQPNPQPQPGGNTGTNPVPPVIPDTSISSDLIALLTVMAGMIFVLVGTALSRSSEDEDDE